MKCPQCEKPMQHSTVGEIILNECQQCRGMWFDQGKLSGVKDEIIPDLGWLDIDGWKEELDLYANPDPMRCPKCQDAAMTTLRDQQSRVEINVCVQCRGSWLATGQFLLMVNALLEEADQKSAPEYARILLTQARDMLSGSDALFSEWEEFKTVFNLLKHRIFIEHPKLKSVVVGLQKSLPL
jgi:Zn-finger nucleic acid-binding protein